MSGLNEGLTVDFDDIVRLSRGVSRMTHQDFEKLLKKWGHTHGSYVAEQWMRFVGAPLDYIASRQPEQGRQLLDFIWAKGADTVPAKKRPVRYRCPGCEIPKSKPGNCRTCAREP